MIGSVGDERVCTELLNSKSQTVPELIAIAKTMRKKAMPERKKVGHLRNHVWKTSARGD